MPRPDSGQVANAALRVLRDEGPQALSFRRVATLLGTSHMTVHRLCESFEGLLDLCAERLAATEQRFASLYGVMSRNSALIALQRGRPWLGPEMMRRFAEPAMAESLSAGLSLEEVIETHRGLWAFTVGCALTHEAHDTRRGGAALDRLDPEQAPVIAAHRDEYTVDHIPQVVFLRGIRALIAAAEPQRPG